MAILVNYGYDSSINNVNPDERYVGETGCIRALLDTTINDRLLFESIIASDFAEVQAIRESASDEEIQSLSEASVEGFFARLKEFIKKIWEKFVGIIKSFLTFIQAHLIRDNKALVKKYDLEIRKKDLSKMKYKWSKYKNDGVLFKYTVEDVYTKSYEVVKDIANSSSAGKNNEERGAYIKETENKEKALQAIFKGDKNIEWDNAYDTIWSHYFHDEEEFEGLDNKRYEVIKGVLELSKTTISEFEKLKTNTDKYFKDRLKEVDNDIKERVEKNKRTKEALLLHATISVAQDVQSKAISNMISVFKRKIKECRAVFIKAASYRGVGESTILTEAMIDVDGQHVDEMFETMSI